MDSLHAIGFYASSAVLLLGGLGVAVLPGRDLRAISLAVTGAGLAGAYLSLSSGFAAIVAVVAYAGGAVMVASRGYRVVEAGVASLWRQVGAAAAAALLAVLAWSAFRADFVQARFTGGAYDARAVARLMLTHDLLATVGIATLGFAAIAGAYTVWRVRDRAR